MIIVRKLVMKTREKFFLKKLNQERKQKKEELQFTKVLLSIRMCSFLRLLP